MPCLHIGQRFIIVEFELLYFLVEVELVYVAQIHQIQTLWNITLDPDKVDGIGWVLSQGSLHLANI